MKQFTVDQEIQDLLDDVDNAIDKLRNVGEFTPAVVDELTREFLPESIRKLIADELLVSRIEDTLAIESIQVNPRVTTSVLEGNALEDIDKYTKQAILNVNSANTFIENEAKLGNPLSLASISEINRLIETGANESKRPGSFRDIPIQITGAVIQPPHWSEIRDLLSEALLNLEGTDLHPVIAASYIHWEVARIHPFENGNGRTARLAQDYVLIRSGLLPVGIPKSQRSAYYKALESADLGDGKALIILIASAVINTLSRAYEIAARPAKRQQKIAQWIDNLQNKNQATKTKQYEIWRSKTDFFQKETKGVLEELNSSQDHVHFNIFVYDIPDKSTWEQMLEVGGASKCFLMRIEVILGGKFAFKMLWFAKRHRLDWILDLNKHLKNEVGFFLDVRDQDSDMFETRQSLIDEKYIGIREVVPSSEGWYYAVDPRVTREIDNPNISIQLSSPNWALHSSTNVGEIVDLFLENVMNKIGE